MIKRPTTIDEDRQAYHRALARAERRANIIWTAIVLIGLASWIVADQIIRPWLATLY